MHPILGPRTEQQVVDALAAVDVSLPAEALVRLEAAVEFSLGFPGDFVADVSTTVFGDAYDRLEGR